MPILQQRARMAEDEREIVDHLVGHVGIYQREVVVNYYVALKTRHFVILAGSSRVDKMCLAEGLADVLVDGPGLQWSVFQAHPWWTIHTRLPCDLALAHERFNNLKLLGSIESAVHNEARGIPYLVGIERMSPAEVVCYFEDLPRGLMWLGDLSTRRIAVPENLYMTGTLDVEGERPALGQEVHRYATVIQIDRSQAVCSLEQHRVPGRRIDRQRTFTASAIRHRDQARARLAQVLPSGCPPLAPLAELAHRLRLASLPLFVLEEVWLYLANAFNGDGRGLFVETALENLRIAQDYALMQSVLPRLKGQWAETPQIWDDVSERFGVRFPRTCAQVQHLYGSGSSDRRKARVGNESSAIQNWVDAAASP